MSQPASIFQKIQHAKIAFAGIQQQKRYILSVASIACFTGWLAVSMLPNQYESSAKVLADTRSMLKPLLSGIAVQNDTEQGIQVIAQTLLSRANLEKIALNADLDIDSGDPERYEKLLATLKEEISISGSSKSNVYNISYSHRDPETARKVVELTLKQFLDTVMRQNKLDSNSATDFLVGQIDERKKSLEAAEMLLAQFKQEHQGSLPQQGVTYYSMLATLRAQLEDLDGNITAKQTELDSLRDTFLPKAGMNGAVVVQTPFDDRLSALQQALDAERLNYTDSHPRIKELQGQIAALEENRRYVQAEILAQAAKGAMTANQTDGHSEALQTFALQISRLESELSVLKTKRTSAQGRLNDLQSKIQVIPAIEAKLTSLQRDYEGSKKLYDELVRRLEQARLSQNANDNTSDVKFQTLEPPRTPLTPSGPPRILFYVMVFFMSLFSGIAVAFAKSKLGGRIVNFSHLSMLVGERKIIGHLLHQDHARLIRRGRWRFIVFLTWLGALTLCLLLLIGYEIKFGHPPGVLLKSLAKQMLIAMGV